MGMIPNNRGVTGRDLDYLRVSLGLSAGDAAWLFGLPMTKWMNIVNQNSDEPLQNPTLALLARMLDAHLDANPLPTAPAATQVYERIKLYRGADHELRPWEMKMIRRKRAYPLDKRTMAVLFGREASSGYRWLTRDSRFSPTLGRLFIVFTTLFDRTKSHAARSSVIRELETFVEIESRARSVEDIWRTGRWSATRRKRTRSKSTEAESTRKAASTKKPKK